MNGGVDRSLRFLTPVQVGANSPQGDIRDTVFAQTLLEPVPNIIPVQAAIPRHQVEFSFGSDKSQNRGQA